jgi:hypothetical protein
LTLIPPVAGYRQAVPAALRAAWSWYCQRIPTVGCQHAPTEVLQGAGVGQPAVVHDAAAGGALMMPEMYNKSPQVIAASAVPNLLISLPSRLPPR